MKKIRTALAGVLLVAAFAAWSQSDAEKAKAKDAADLTRAQDKAVANYKKNKGSAAGTRKPDASSSSGTTAKPRPDEYGADHAKADAPDKDLTRKEAQTEMPTPGQANDHSSTARETVPSGR